MLPKFDVWPKSFQISQPSDDNIALYFFPENERYEKVFDRLVLDMVSHELAMQTVVENAELLVFASTELPLRHWRFHGKLYLWGVFRGKQVSSTSCQVDDRHLIPNSSKESVTSSNLANDAGIRKEKDTSMVTTWDSRSPLSPLSNSGKRLLYRSLILQFSQEAQPCRILLLYSIPFFLKHFVSFTFP
ncbi:unnamed protein product, partial [Vitis vinifera]